MKNKAFFGLVLFIFIFSLSILSCSSGSNSNVKIRINLGLQNENALNTHENSIFDSFLRLFTKDAKALVPSGITSFSLAVTGEGMDAINNTYAPETTTITLEVPAGNARLFQLTAYRPTGNYGGSATSDLTAGTSVDIPITMAAQNALVTINPSYLIGTPSSASLTCTVNVTTSGEAVLSSSFTPGTPIQVPAGSNRDFEILVSTPSATLRGIATGQNLAALETVILNPIMSLYRTKQLIPDTSNNRLVQIDDMTGANPGAGWTVFDFNNLTAWGSSLEFVPYDVDYDSIGRIYIANSYSLTDRDVIIRTDNISGGNIISFGQNGWGYIAIAVDRKNNILYKADSFGSLSRCNLDGSSDSGSLTFNGITGAIASIRALTLDDNGMLYISYYTTDFNTYVGLFNPTATSVDLTASYQITSGTPYGVLFKYPYVYIANLYGGNDNLIIRLNSDLASASYIGYGQYYAGTEGQGIFYEPNRFVAKLNDKITITDADCSMDKLVSMDDIAGNGWKTYGTYGGLQDQFFFFLGGCK